VDRNNRVVSTFERVLDSIGLAIVQGELAAGHVDTVDGLVARTSASRSIVREATRVLASLGMIRAGRRIGLTVLDRDEWQLLDPRVIRWRDSSDDRPQQENELRDLRRAIEGEAARLAAIRHTESQMAVLIEAIDGLERAARMQDPSAFFAADREFHAAVLRMSGSGMLMRLQSVVDEALRLRTPDTSARWQAAPGDVQLHRALVTAIEERDPDASGELMARIAEG
jgi:DNA-binding FadR family transcriptional regulator